MQLPRHEAGHTNLALISRSPKHYIKTVISKFGNFLILSTIDNNSTKALDTSV